MFMNDHSRLMRESVSLTEEMNHLRREAKQLKRRHKAVDVEVNQGVGTAGGSAQMSDGFMPTPPKGGGRSVGSGTGSGAGGRQIKSNQSTSSVGQTQREIEMQRSTIMTLEDDLRRLQVDLGVMRTVTPGQAAMP